MSAKDTCFNIVAGLAPKKGDRWWCGQIPKNLGAVWLPDAANDPPAEGMGVEHPKKTRDIRAILAKAVRNPVQCSTRRLERPISP